jgi:hypothetical protein
LLVEAANPFAQVPSTPEPIIAQVRRELAADCDNGPCPKAAELDRAASIAVRELWQARVRTFVPVLALRQAREMLHVGPVWHSTTELESAETPSRATASASLHDVLPLSERDILVLDESDKWTFRDD